MKKSFLGISVLLAMSATIAEYNIKYPLEVNKGGNLPNGSITFTNKSSSLPTENWVSIEPLYSEWINDGIPFNCKLWTPEESTVTYGQTFTQTANDCEQEQIRTRQEREQETTNLIIRDVGSPSSENRILTSQLNTRTSVGTMLDCLYSGIESDPAPRYRVLYQPSGSTSYNERFEWNGTLIHGRMTSIANPRNLSITSGGYIYTLGELVENTAIKQVNEICRRPV